MQTDILINSISDIDEIFKSLDIKKPFLCCGKSFEKTEIFEYISKFDPIVWDNIRPNPRYEDMRKATKLFKKEHCDFMIGAGGGSPLDSAKMIKLMATNSNINPLTDEMDDNDIPFLAIPTTSGTGSEVTRYSIFYSGIDDKHSITHDGFLPNYVLLEPKLLLTLPEYQKKCTCLDALSHAIESLWSVKANEESTSYAEKAITLFKDNEEEYMKNTLKGNKGMLMASYYAGKAINITSTTAAHAMCYNLTMHCGTSHGHSVAVSLKRLWEFALNDGGTFNLEGGKAEFKLRLDKIENALGVESGKGLDYLKNLLKKYKLPTPLLDEITAEKFANTVNIDRLSNHPQKLTALDIKSIYLAK